MEKSVFSELALPLLISGLLFAYSGYCWMNQKVLVRGIGWKSKEEYPKSFYFTIVILVVLGTFQLFMTVFFYFND